MVEKNEKKREQGQYQDDSPPQSARQYIRRIKNAASYIDELAEDLRSTVYEELLDHGVPEPIARRSTYVGFTKGMDKWKRNTPVTMKNKLQNTKFSRRK